MVVVASLLTAGVYYFLQRGTRVSGLEKRYQTAREATLGGIDVFTKEIVPAVIQGGTLNGVVGGFTSITNALVQQGATTTCFNTKILQPTASWGACGDSSTDAKRNPDVTFQLSGLTPTQYFNVYAKITDTIPGNSDTSGFSLEGQGVAESGGGMITVQHYPYMYHVETQGERQAAPEEKARFSILYAY